MAACRLLTLSLSLSASGTFSQTNCLYGIISLNAAGKWREREEGEEEKQDECSLYFQRGEIRCDVRVRKGQLDSACVIKGPSPVWRGREGRKGRRGLQSEGRNGNDSEQRTPGNGASRLGGQSAGKSRPFGASDPEWCSTNRSLPGPPFTPLLVSHMNIQSRPTDRQSVPHSLYPIFNFGAQISSIRGRRQSGPNPITFFAFFPSPRAQNDRESSFSLSILPRICHF